MMLFHLVSQLHACSLIYVVEVTHRRITYDLDLVVAAVATCPHLISFLSYDAFFQRLIDLNLYRTTLVRKAAAHEPKS